MIPIHCTNCRQPYPESGVPYRCTTCGGLFDFSAQFPFDSDRVETDQPGIWRYRHAFGLPQRSPVVSLGEGSTPLIWGRAFGKRVAFKCEDLNPTGSFKDRGSALMVSFLRSRQVESAVEDSSGNAGASFAAYSARGGLRARLFVPDSTSGPKRAQIEAYGAELVRIMGPRSNASEAVQQAADRGSVYASHAYLPLNLAGYATLAYELVEQLGQAPGAVMAPVGQGGLILGIGRGFQAMLAAGLISKIPSLVGVQARACAPLWALHRHGPAGLGWVAEGPTLAEGIRVHHPVRGDAVLRMVQESQGTFLVVDEEEILPGRDQLAHQGFYIEPTSAVIWSALGQVIDQLPEPIVTVLSGSGYKYQA